MSQVVGLPNNSYKPITNTAWICARLCKLQKGCTRLAAANDEVYQLLGHGQWFSPGTPASFTTKTGRHDIAEILLKVALSTKINQSWNIVDHDSSVKHSMFCHISLVLRFSDVYRGLSTNSLKLFGIFLPKSINLCVSYITQFSFQDLVAWVTLDTTHIPHSEDFPTMSTTNNQQYFTLSPFNLFPEDPSAMSPDTVTKDG